MAAWPRLTYTARIILITEQPKWSQHFIGGVGCHQPRLLCPRRRLSPLRRRQRRQLRAKRGRGKHCQILVQQHSTIENYRFERSQQPSPVRTVVCRQPCSPAPQRSEGALGVDGHAEGVESRLEHIILCGRGAFGLRHDGYTRAAADERTLGPALNRLKGGRLVHQPLRGCLTTSAICASSRL